MATQTATIVVSDLVGSTALRIEVGEERAERLRRGHDRALVDAARAHGGTVVKGLGDGVLVMFAGAAEALAAAVAMQRSIDVLGRHEAAPLLIRVGISAGDVTFEDGDCFGVPVVEASRLCAAAEGGQVLAAEVVRLLARGRGGHEMTALGDLELKGLPEPVPAFDVGWKQTDGAVDLRIRTPYVGREKERQLLAGRIKAARDGLGGSVLVAGEPGIGKTRLAVEVCEQFDDVITLVGGCHDGDVVPFAPLVEALTEWVRGNPVDTVRAVLGRDAAVVARLAPAIHEVVVDIGEPVPVPADAETTRLHDAVGQVLTRLSAHTPLVLVFDDLHWADDATVGMLRSLARLATRLRLLVVGMYRDADLDGRHPFAVALPLLQHEAEPTRIVLNGLGPDDVRSLLERLSGHKTSPEFAALLAHETDGNPLFVRETLLHLVDEGRLRVANDVWVADAVAGLGIPATVREVIGRRLSRLSPHANKLLAAGALFEVSFPITIAAAVTKLDEGEALDAIDEALEARIVAATDEFDRYAFTHALFRHTLEDKLSPSRQVRMHRAIAEAIESDLRGAPDATTAATLARHYLQSAAIPGAERGVPYAVATADDAATRYARDEELTALRGAATLLADADDRALAVRCRIAQAAVLAQVDPETVLADAELAAHELATADGDHAAADFAADLLDRAMLLEDVTVCWRLARLTRRWLDPERRDLQWTLVRQAELEERDYHDPLTPGIPVDDDEYRELRSVIERLPSDATERFRCAGAASGSEARANLDGKRVFDIFSSGLWRQGIGVVGERREMFRAQGLVAMEAFVIAMRSRLKLAVGDLDGAASDCDTALAMLPRISPESNQYFQVVSIPTIRDLIGGAIPDATLADVLLDFAERPNTRWLGLRLRLTAARALAFDRQHDRARAILASAMPALERAAAWAPNYAVVCAYAVEVAWRLGDATFVPALERNVREKWLDPDLAYPEVDARWSYALLCDLDGRTDDARQWFAEARRILAARESEPLIVGVDHDAAEMELRLGPVGDAAHFAACIAAARSRCTHPAMAAWLPRLDVLETRAADAFGLEP